MKNTKQKKSGFTLVELMVVAIIVAILAAVAIPLMSGNSERAMATEGQTGCSTVANALKLYMVETGITNAVPPNQIDSLTGITDEDLQGNYYQSYTINSVGGPTTYTITASKGTAGKATGDLQMNVVNGSVTWLGLGQKNDIPTP